MSSVKYRDPATGQWISVPGMAVTGGEYLQHGEIPDYVKQEALKLAEKVRAVQTGTSITFLAMSDSHHCAGQDNTDWQENTNAGNLHACMGAKILSYCLNLDFVCHLGDLTFGHSTTTTEQLKSQIEQLNLWLRDTWKGIPQFRTVGNHDTGLYGGELVGAEYLYSVIGSHCTGAVYGSTEHGYCYRDFPEKKLRVICLNTSEGETLDGNNASYICSEDQLIWFAQTMQEVGSWEGWSILVLSHYPLDYLSTHPAAQVVKAYLDGDIFLRKGIPVNFANQNLAKFVAQFHGHTHCLKYDKLCTIDTAAMESTPFEAWRVAVPNAGFYRNNHHSTPDKYGISFGEDTTYDKISGSGLDTAFTVNVVDPQLQVIYSFCYGAGYDRIISYGDIQYCQVEATLYYVQIPDFSRTVVLGNPLKLTLEPLAGYALASVRVFMDDTEITDSVVEGGLIFIPEVTGNIAIHAVATPVGNYVNQIPISTDEEGNIYNSIGYKAGYRLETSGGETAESGMYATGFIPCKYGDYIYLKNVTFEYGSITATNQRLSFYDAEKNHLGQLNANVAASIRINGELATLRDAKNVYTQLAVGDGDIDCTNAAYFRISGTYIGADSIITVNEPIS